MSGCTTGRLMQQAPEGDGEQAHDTSHMHFAKATCTCTSHMHITHMHTPTVVLPAVVSQAVGAWIFSRNHRPELRSAAPYMASFGAACEW